MDTPPDASHADDDRGRAAAAPRADGALEGPADPRVKPVDLRDYVHFEMERPTRVRVLRSEQLALDLWCLEPRAVTGALHFPDQDVTYTVIAGRSWFVTDEGEVGLDPMGAILVPADVAHGFENRSPDPLIVVAHSSPPGGEQPGAPAATTAKAVHTTPEPGMVRRAMAAILGTSPGGDTRR